MAEIKHTFTAGKMNKDLDERLVPNGEYRDAMNIQVRTTDGDAGGTVQNLQGNKEFASVHSITNNESRSTKCIGSVSDEKNDKAYFLFASPEITYNFESTTTELYIDSIVEQSSDTSYTNVVTDFWGAKIPVSGITLPASPSDGYISIAVNDQSLFRVGSTIRAINSSGVNLLEEDTKVADLSSDGNSILLNKENTGDLASTNIIVTNPKVLGLDYNGLVTGINVIDDFLFYTTNTSEPKKVNIRRCKKGTSGITSHTKLYVDASNVLKPITDFENNSDGYLREEHIAVMKKAPRTAPEIELFKAQREGDIEWLTSYSSFVSGGTPEPVGFNGMLPSLPDNVNFIEDDVLVFTSQNDDSEAAVVRVKVTSIYPGSITLGDGSLVFDSVFFTILSISDNITASHTEWLVSLEQPTKSIFELKFPRFAYRYKYNDNEYSSFSPWSDVAFIPGDFKYEPSDGYNLGMTNLVKQINIKGFIEDQRVRPDEVKAVDILYKSSDSPIVYVVKTIERDVDPEWEVNTFYGSSGKVVLTTEMIHNMLPSNQVLRTWDNVPRYAKAQEIVGNRLTFGNYTQGYDIPFKPNLRQLIKSSDINQVGKPERSIKSLRNYKAGVVFGDKYGRETPVVATGTKINENDSISYSYGSDDSILSKSFSGKVNKFSIAQDWSSQEVSINPPEWMSYFKYYIKETSNEYYNLTMDRWYDGQDKSVWLSFNSADRNKVDEETYLILKNGHGNNTPITGEARYKILAIENEAPDFIKTSYKLLTSQIPVPTENLNTDPTSGETQELMYSNEFTLGDNGIAVLTNNNIKGKLRVRIKATIDEDTATFITTKWVDVNNLDNTGLLTISELFGAQADIYNIAVSLGHFTNTTTAASELDGYIKFEIGEFSIDNKPEFDGKFFVKILRDNALTTSVLGNSVDNFLVDEVCNFYYVNTVSPNPATTGEYKDYVWSGFNFFEASTLSTFSSSGGASNTWNYWDAFQSQDNSTLENIFFDDAEMYYAAQVPEDFSEATFEPKGFEAVSLESQLNGSPLGTDGSITRLYISTTDVHVFNDYDWSINSSVTNYSTKPWFSSFMESFEQGAIFRFTGDPNRTVYKVDYQYDGQYRVKNADGFYPDFIAGQPSMFRMGFVINIQRISNSGQLTGSGIDVNDWDPRGAMKHDGTSSLQIEVLDTFDGTLLDSDSGVTALSAMWETEPKEDLDLDLYYEASSGIPMRLDSESTVYFSPVGSKYSATRDGETVVYSDSPVVGQVHDGVVLIKNNNDAVVKTNIHIGDIAEFTRGDGSIVRSKILDHIDTNVNGTGIKPSDRGTFTGSHTAGESDIFLDSTTDIELGMLITGGDIPLHSYVTGINPDTSITVANNANDPIPTTDVDVALNYTDITGYYSLDKDVYKYAVDLQWFNCWSFGNGVESDRIRDDFNANTLDNGVKVSSVFLDYQEEKRKNSIIYSGLYNGDSNVNDLNQFIMAEKITKDLNPLYGSIQALKTRDTDLVTFTQDKVLRVLANKDALYNADGNPKLIATDRVLGQAVPFTGDYGISNNPESLAWDQYRIYFTDKQRGAVLRLSRDGLTPISNVGMKTWFRDNLRDSNKIIGSFDVINGEYNITTEFKEESQKSNTTLSFNEASKGWVSFKSFVTQAGTSVSGKYYTSTGDTVYEHYRDDVDRGCFYGTTTPATISVLFNDIPGSVKNFNTINYEGTTGKSELVNNVDVSDILGNTVTASDGLYTSNSTGWSVDSITTDLDSGLVNDFYSKENKWFGNIVGTQKSDNDIFSYDLNEDDFTIQGIGLANDIDVDSNWDQGQVEIIIQGE